MNIHPQFKLQDNSFNDSNKLLKYVREHFPSHISFLEELFNENKYIIAHTSGSTGKPKPIKLNKKNLIKSAQASIDFFNLKPGTKALLNLSTDFIAGKMMWVRALYGGWNLYIASPENQQIQKILSQYSFDFGAMVPMQVIYNLDQLDRFKLLIIGGANLDMKYQKKLNNKSTAVFATYGMTETITHVAVKPLNNSALKQKPNFQENTYTALPGITFSKDKRDCLQIKAPFVPKPIQTNDVVKLLNNYQFKWLGRYDQVINSGGIKIFPEQIEKKISPYIHNEFMIGSISDPILGEKMVLLIEGQKKVTIPFEKILPKYHIPKEIFYLSEFIRTSSGKINRRETIKIIK
jgi:O-succinylbenzoic acid--CoA ligase